MHALLDPDDHNECNAVLRMHSIESNEEILRKNDLSARDFLSWTDLNFFFPRPSRWLTPYHRMGNGGWQRHSLSAPPEAHIRMRVHSIATALPYD